jgi:hypothetical protein
MKAKSFLLLSAAFALIMLPDTNFGQAPNLGTASTFVLFSTVGAVSNAGISQITGNAGSNNGATTGFGTLSGVLYNADAISAQCSTDLLVAYNQLNSAVPTLFPGVLLGNGQVLTPGVYAIPAATSLNATLTLDAQGNANAVFIFQINGAFSTTTLSRVNLINGASACNVFWKVEGAVSMAAGSSMAGTLIANNAAISMAAGDTLEGRALSTTGAVAVSGVLASVGCGFIVLPLGLSSFTGVCDNGNTILEWSTATEADNKYFTVERSAGGTDWEVIGTVGGAGNSASPHTYSVTDKTHSQSNSFYRVMQTDFDGNNKYSVVLIVQKCSNDASGDIIPYPNPSDGKFALLYTGDRSQVTSTKIFNVLGEKVYESAGFTPEIDLTGKAPGAYFLQIHLNSRTIQQEIIVKNDH